MPQRTEQKIMDIRNNIIRKSSYEFDEEICEHFEGLCAYYWGDVADESLRLWNCLFNENLSDESTVAKLLSASTRSAALGVISTFAKIMKLDESILAYAVFSLHEELGEPNPPPLTHETLMNAYRFWGGSSKGDEV